MNKTEYSRKRLIEVMSRVDNTFTPNKINETFGYEEQQPQVDGAAPIDSVAEEFQPDYSDAEFFQGKLEEIFLQMKQSGYDEEAMMSLAQKALPIQGM